MTAFASLHHKDIEEGKGERQCTSHQEKEKGRKGMNPTRVIRKEWPAETRSERTLSLFSTRDEGWREVHTTRMIMSEIVQDGGRGARR